MIISASRRTDIPAFYAPWFMNRIRSGYCTVPNPYHHRQVSRISLKPEEVDVIVFWTRNPRPLLPFLDELDSRGYRYYFQVTLMENPRFLDPHCLPTGAAIAGFRELADRIGPGRVIWRYDPIVFGEATGPPFHRRAFSKIAGALRGATGRAVVSVVDIYRKNERRLREFSRPGIDRDGAAQNGVADTLPALADAAAANGMEIVSCAEAIDLAGYGIRPGKCVDDTLIRETFGIEVTRRKDPAQRKACGCVVSRDIGMYDSCLFGCRYCYATSSFQLAEKNRRAHDPRSPSLVGWHEAPA